MPDKNVAAQDFEIRLPLFEGPFDLLLFFIERDELDIYDIPISDITRDFLDYLHRLEQMNMEVASEFILVAATLMRIKAKMLLPRQELDAEGNEIDPREELIRHLLEYKRYKSVLEELRVLEEQRLMLEQRGNLRQELRMLASKDNVEEELQDLDLYKLLRVYQRVMERYRYEQDRPVHRVIPFPYTIDERKDAIMARFTMRERISFTQLLEEDPNKVAAIFNFLAILELIQLELIVLQIGEGYNNFWIEKKEEEHAA